MSLSDFDPALIEFLASYMDPLSRQAFALTCSTAYKTIHIYRSDIFNYLPEGWRNFRSDDPVRHYYYPLLYRALREAPTWMYTWTLGSKKKVSSWTGMQLTLVFSPPRKEGEPYDTFTFYYLSNSGLPWKFSSRGRLFSKVFNEVGYKKE